eukprot:7666208-Lingulodinium_polyedra.AAC.1
MCAGSCSGAPRKGCSQYGRRCAGHTTIAALSPARHCSSSLPDGGGPAAWGWQWIALPRGHRPPTLAPWRKT